MSLCPFLIDCDTGRDDALTFWLASALGLPLVGAVTSYGNTGLDNVVENTSRVLSFVRKNHIPLLRGASAPLSPHRLYHSLVLPRQAASGNGLCNRELPLSGRQNNPTMTVEENAKIIRDLAHKNGPLDYFIIGPATNLAHFLEVWGAEASSIVAQVTMMGGKFAALWESDPVPDFNVACDPFAVRAVLQSGLPMRFLPLNETWPIEISLSQIEGLVARDPLAQQVKDIMMAHCRYFAPQPVFKFHDPTILLAALNEGGFKERLLDVTVDETSPLFGQVFDTAHGVSSKVYEMTPEIRAQFVETILEKLGLASS